MIETLHTDNAPAAIGPYSQAKIVNGILYASGQIAINPQAVKWKPTPLWGKPNRFAKISPHF